MTTLDEHRTKQGTWFCLDLSQMLLRMGLCSTFPVEWMFWSEWKLEMDRKEEELHPLEENEESCL